MRSRGTSGGGSASAIYATTPQIANLQAAPTNNLDTGNFSRFTVDNRVRGNGYLSQFAPALNDYLGMQFTIGPQGSIWALRWSYAVAPDAGKFRFSIASVPEPDPDRAGVDDAGSLLNADDLTYIPWGGTTDGYAAAFADSQSGGQLVQRFKGADHAALTTIDASIDPWTFFGECDGGSGVYRVRLEVFDKNAASTGYKVYLTALALVRLDDNGFE